jgi:two-component system chemotaxis sensor kinase CheA
MELFQLLPDFQTENLARINAMERALFCLNESPGCYAALYDLIEITDALKKSAGLFGLERVIATTSAMEELMVRAGQSNMAHNDELTDLLLACCEHLAALVEQPGDSEWSPPNALLKEDLLGRMKDFAHSGAFDNEDPSGKWDANLLAEHPLEAHAPQRISVA